MNQRITFIPFIFQSPVPIPYDYSQRESRPRWALFFTTRRSSEDIEKLLLLSVTVVNIWTAAHEVVQTSP